MIPTGWIRFFETRDCALASHVYLLQLAGGEEKKEAQGGKEEEDAPFASKGHDGNPRRPQNERNGVAYQERLACRKDPLPEAEGKVVGAAEEHRYAALPADVHHEEGIEDRHTEDDGRNDGGGHVVLGVSPDHRQRTEAEADKETARVAEIDLRRRKVEAEKAEEAAGESGRKNGDLHVAVDDRDGEESDGGDKTHAGGETVHDVDDIEGVRDTEEPDVGEHQGDGPGKVVELYHDPSLHEGGDGKALTEEFRPRRDGPDIVDEAEEHNDRAGKQNGQDLAIEIIGHGQGAEESEIHPHSAKIGDGLLLLLEFSVGVVYELIVPGNPDGHGRKDVGEKGSQAEGETGENPLPEDRLADDPDQALHYVLSSRCSDIGIPYHCIIEADKGSLTGAFPFAGTRHLIYSPRRCIFRRGLQAFCRRNDGSLVRGDVSMSKKVIEVREVSKRYRIGSGARGQKTLRESLAERLPGLMRRGSVTADVTTEGRRGEEDLIWALKDVSFSVSEGEVLGMIGKNGSGKTTMLKILAGITEPAAGSVVIEGTVSSLLEVGTGFHPELTGRENIFLNGAILGMRKREILEKFEEIVDFAEIHRYIDTPIKRYSSGMQVRLAFAVAAHLEPNILLVDEVLAVGDIAFQRKCMGKVRDVSRAGRTVILVSHNMAAIRHLCEKVLWLDRGGVLSHGGTDEVVRAYEEKQLRLFDTSSCVADRPPADVAGLDFYIRRVAMTDSAGKETNIFPYHTSMSLDVDLTGEPPDGTFGMEFRIFKESGEYACTGTSGPMHGIYFDGKAKKIRIEIGPLIITSGRYTLSVYIMSPQKERIDKWENACWFHVTECHPFPLPQEIRTPVCVVDHSFAAVQ